MLLAFKGKSNSLLIFLKIYFLTPEISKYLWKDCLNKGSVNHLKDEVSLLRSFYFLQVILNLFKCKLFWCLLFIKMHVIHIELQLVYRRIIQMFSVKFQALYFQLIFKIAQYIFIMLRTPTLASLDKLHKTPVWRKQSLLTVIPVRETLLYYLLVL